MNNFFLNPKFNIMELDTFIIRRSILKTLKDHLALFEGALLDVGCGQMPYKCLICEQPLITKYIGLDFQSNPIHLNNPDIVWKNGKIPLSDSSIDCAIATEVLEHCPFPEAVLNEICRVLKPGALLFFTVPFLWPLHEVPYDEYRYTPYSLKRHLTNCNFTDIQIKPLGGWDASLAQMLGLWVRRRPMGRWKRWTLSCLFMPVIFFLYKSDFKVRTHFNESSMITGISGTAKKTGKKVPIDIKIMKLTKRPKSAYPLAVISNRLGVRSETFIYKHMTELLPGKTTVIARSKESHILNDAIDFPCLLIDETKNNLAWLLRAGFFSLKIEKFSPVQISVEQFLKRHKVQVILSEYLDHSLKWLPVARSLGIRFFAHAHGYDVSRKMRDPITTREYLQLAAADGIITMSEYSRKKLVDIGLNTEKIVVIPYGTFVPDTPLIRKNQIPVRCLAVGRMVAKKAPLLTLAAFHRALESNHQMHLDYVGDGDLLDKAQQYIDDHHLKKYVTLHGSQPNQTVLKLMKAADIFVQHSRTDPETGDEEGMPVAILEAMANSLPVVSTYHAGIPEAVVEDVTGFLVAENDAEAMAEKIAQLANNTELRNCFGQAGWMRAKQHFTWEQEKAALLDLLGLKSNTK